MNTNSSSNRFIDKVLLYYPLFLYVFTFTYLASLSSEWGRDQIVLWLIITFIILGNFAHNFLSFWQIARIPEFKTWSKNYRFKKLNIWQLAALFYFILLAIVITVTPEGFNTFSNPMNMTTVTGWVTFGFMALNIHHNIAQMKGLCISLSYKNSISVSQTDLMTMTQKEKIFHHLLFLDWIVFMLWSLYFRQWLGDHFLIVRTFWLLGLTIYLISIYKNIPAEIRFQKLIYNIRHIYRFFFSLHPIVPFLSFGIHGADAILIYLKATLKTESIHLRRRLTTEFAVLFMILGAVFLAIKNYKLDQQSWHQAIVAVFLTHYIVEGFMYRMQNPLTKKHIAPLL